MEPAVALSNNFFLEPAIDLTAMAKASIQSTIAAGHPLVVGWSGGKDSTTVLNLVLSVAKERAATGAPLPPIVVTHADTLVENPEVARHVRAEVEKIERYAKQHGIPLRLEIAEPSLNDQLLVKIIGGRCLPVFASKSARDCTIDLKIKPQKKLKKAVFEGLKKEDKPPVTVIGTRFDESTGRKARMEQRGETGEGVWTSPAGDLMLSPIADWRDVDVWEYLEACSRGDEPAYSLFESLFRLYRDGSEPTPPGHQALDCRFGCHICTVGRDKSLENMLKCRERYRYMEGLNRLQRFLLSTQYDLDRRQWIGRSINEQGYIAIRPDVYSPAMLEELLRYALTIDMREKEAAFLQGIEPRFELIPAQALIAIDAMWSLQGLHPAHHALKLFREIYHEGKRYEIPEIHPGQPAQIPEARYLYVGLGWKEPGSSYAFSGLRNVVLEAMTEGGGCMGTRDLKNGTTIMDVETAPAFAIDLETAHFIIGFELDYLLQNYGDENRSRTSAYRYYASLGCLQLAKGSQAAQVDLILRRTAFKERNGLSVGPGFDLQQILARTVSEKDMKMPDRQTGKVSPHLHRVGAEPGDVQQMAFAWA